MSEKKLTGGCLCGAVRFTVQDSFRAFYQCHCRQCQQLTGSAFASNIFTDPGNISWISGQDDIVSYTHPSRDFSKSFCGICGCAVPFVTKSKTSLIVPAGSLNDQSSIEPQANIFTDEQACWLEPGSQAQRFGRFPG